MPIIVMPLCRGFIHRVAFLIAHLSDPHIGPLPRIPLASLFNKRLTGVLNWHGARAEIHSMAILDHILADIVAHRPDHVALTGDLVNVGFPIEFPQAEKRLALLGGPRDVSVIPGNHDAYIRQSLPAMIATFGDFMRGDGQPHDGAITFPYLRRRGNIALIGVNSGVPTAPFMATGEVGAEQRTALAVLLEATGREGLFRLVMIHHPPLPGVARFGRGLRDAAQMRALLEESGAELVIHGHNHRFSLDYVPHAGRRIPIVGVASASAVPGTPHHHAQYHLYRLDDAATPPTLTLERRGFDTNSRMITSISRITLEG